MFCLFFGKGGDGEWKRRDGDSFSAELISFLAAGMYLGSHFAAYQIGQVLGLLESLGLLLAITVLWLLYRFSEYGKSGYYYGAAFVYNCRRRICF